MPGGRIAPLNEINTAQSVKNALPPIANNRVLSLSSSSISKTRAKRSVDADRGSKELDQEPDTSEFISSSSSNFRIPHFPNIIDTSPQGSKPELRNIKIKKMHRMLFPRTTRKLMLPDEAERPIINGTNASISSIASPYIQIIKEEGALSMALLDPLCSIPKIDVSHFIQPHD